MFRYSATASISSRLTQPPFCACTMCSAGSTADWRWSGGYFASQASICAREAALISPVVSICAFMSRRFTLRDSAKQYLISA